MGLESVARPSPTVEKIIDPGARFGPVAQSSIASIARRESSRILRASSLTICIVLDESFAASTGSAGAYSGRRRRSMAPLTSALLCQIASGLYAVDGFETANSFSIKSGKINLNAISPQGARERRERRKTPPKENPGPKPGVWSCTYLERVTQEELHYSAAQIATLDRSKVGEVVRRVSLIGIQRDAETAAAPVEGSHALMVEDVENLPAELQLVVLGDLRCEAVQVEGFAESHVDVVVAGHAEDVTFTGFTWVGVSEMREREVRVAAEQLRSAIDGPRGARLKISSPYCVALDFPVRCPSRVVKHACCSIVEPDRQAGIPAKDSAELPAPDEAVCDLPDIGEQGPAVTERHLPDGIDVDLVPDVEVRVRIHVTLAERVKDERFAVVAGAVLQPGGIIQGVRVGVVEIGCQGV